jgi:hypothetical protein
VVGLTRIYDPTFHELEGFMDMVSRGFGYSVARPSRSSRGVSGTLRREERGECCGYFKCSVW